ncbi:MAG: hypothetical protein KatS3mg057_0499 [Herpetosiphonaceae bacterium]|nr:MAG: hypothetical protein KatS3mg057_0499 [Herpetosiphonaceae bacterium]
MSNKKWVMLPMLALLVLGLWPQSRSNAAGEQLFVETGWRVGGHVLEFWQRSGGLAVFGLPLGPEQRERTGDGTYALQRFERARVELHPEKRAPYNVELGRVGADLLARQQRNWSSEIDEQLLTGQCRSFPETGRQVCGPFLDYWLSHGLDLGDEGVSYRESLALFGLPLTGTRMETNSSGDRVITQWFERARFEYHPKNPQPYTVLLGRLGAELSGEPPPLPQPAIAILPQTSILQGHTLTVEVKSSEATGVSGMLGSTALAFTRRDGSWLAIGAVHGLQQPGPLQVRVEAALADGRTATGRATIQVIDAGYPVEYINLPPDVRDSIANNREALEAENARVRAIWPVVTPQRLWNGRFIMPTEGVLVSSYGGRRSYNGGPVSSFHEGIDIANAVGTPIIAPAAGNVVLAGTGFIARGGAVILDHGWGIHTGYWHMEEVLVSEGQFVEQGQVIGLMGARGMVTGPHLHWELRIGPHSADPLEWINREWPPSQPGSRGKAMPR